MKSFVAYPFELDILIQQQQVPDRSSGKLVAHFELFKKIKNLDGAIVKCGISAEEGFTRFAMFKALTGNSAKNKLIAFQKQPSCFEEAVDEHGELVVRVKGSDYNASTSDVQQMMVENGLLNQVDFVPGDVNDAIPTYLIENAELKIAMLNIDLDDYEATTNALEYLYPRLVEGGILIIDNYYKNLGERRAVDDYFANNTPQISNFSISKGPHYMVKA